MASTQNAAQPHSEAAPPRKPEAPRRARRARWTLRQVLNTLGYSIARKDDGELDCESLPLPSKEMVERAEATFANSFPISANCRLTEAQIAEKAKDYFWHYPFRFGNVFIDSDQVHFKGLDGRHYQRYVHIFAPLLSLAGGSLAGKTVLDVACNAGFWTIQARRAGADRVLGLDVSPKNVEQAKLIQDVIGIDGIDYGMMNAYDVSRESAGEFDITFFLGLLYHLDRPVEALERLYDVTRSLAVVDTTLARSDIPSGMPVLKLEEDLVHDQNISNRIALVPSKNAVPLLLKHVGFKEVFRIQNASSNLPLDYRTGTRMTFIARK